MRPAHRIRCLTCGTDEHIHIPWTPANVLRVVGNGVVVVATLPVSLVVFLVGIPRVYTPFTLARRCSGCCGVFLKGVDIPKREGGMPEVPLRPDRECERNVPRVWLPIRPSVAAARERDSIGRQGRSSGARACRAVEGGRPGGLPYVLSVGDVGVQPAVALVHVPTIVDRRQAHVDDLLIYCGDGAQVVLVQEPFER